MFAVRAEPVQPLRIGLIGLGVISEQIIANIKASEGCVLAAGADIRAEARRAFEAEHGLPAFEDAETLCAGDHIDVAWTATPNHLHCATGLAALRNGKHLVCEKPLAISLAECDALVEAADAAGVLIVQGHSKIFEAPIRAMRAVLDEGALGAALQVDIWLFNDWLQRPRLAGELDESLGGGVVMRQGPHLADIARYLAGGQALSLRATAGSADSGIGLNGNFAALIEFDTGAAAALSFNGYGYFDVAELSWGVDASGRRVDIEELRRPKARRRGPLEAEEKFTSALQSAPARRKTREPRVQPFFGLTIVSCERGVMRQSPDGLLLYSEHGCKERVIAPNPPGAPELHELRAALREARAPFPDAKWGRATVEICLGITESASRRRSIVLGRQSPIPSQERRAP